MNLSREGVESWLREQQKRLSKFKYPVLILLLGIGLMLLSPGGKKTPPPTAQSQPAEQEVLQSQLEVLLSQVEGAGKVRVLLTMEAGTAYTYQTDEETTGTERRVETVLVSGENGETAVTRQTVYPTYKGALVVCQGADSAAVRLDLVKAVSSLTGLGSDKITVIKMK